MTQKERLNNKAKAMIVQKHQLNNAQQHLGSLNAALESILNEQMGNQQILDQIAFQIESSQVIFEMDEEEALLVESSLYEINEKPAVIHNKISTLDCIEITKYTDWNDYFGRVESYAECHKIVFREDPFLDLMSASQRISLEKRIKDEFTYKNANCDRYDYMIAATCGLIGGLIDVVFVGLPGQGKLTHFTDDMTDKIVQGFAKLNGWSGPNEGSDSVGSAIGFLERNYKVNYDHRHGGDVDDLFKMSTKNHHIKSLGHSPDLAGLFFSILDQFTSTAHFVDGGKIISVDTNTFELKGSNFIAKVFSGFINWFGHLFSDVAGSSGAQGRGSGIPIPFFSLLQFIDIGRFGQHRQTFAKVSVQVFEQGYDFRHGMALSIPVLITELLTRATWVFKQRFYHEEPWSNCIPSANNPELRRMLLIAHGSLSLVDITDATLRSGGNIIQFMLYSNLIAWTRFGALALKEFKVWCRKENIDIDAVDAYLDVEYKRLLVG